MPYIMKKLFSITIMAFLVSFTQCNFTYHKVFMDFLASLESQMDTQKIAIPYYSYHQGAMMAFEKSLSEIEKNFLQQAYIEELSQMVAQFQLSPFTPTNIELHEFYKKAFILEKEIDHFLKMNARFDPLYVQDIQIVLHSYISLSILTLHAYDHLRLSSAYKHHMKSTQQEAMAMQSKTIALLTTLLAIVASDQKDMVSFYEFHRSWVATLDLKIRDWL